MTDSGIRRYSSRIVAGGTLACMVFSVPATAAEHTLGADGFAPRIEDIVVTGPREQRLADMPRSGVVINDIDLELLPSTSLVDILGREANLVLRSTTGNEKRSGIDIRGQGDTNGSNVIVMLDGIRLNAEDLSGTDFSIVPFNQIERVEVIRGANTVRYGNGAVGGVINIRTKPASEGATLQLRGRGGSFDTTDVGVDASYATDRAFVSAGAARYDSDGYRDNSFLEKDDLRVRAGVSQNEWLSATLSADFHRDDYGLPGPAPDFDTEEGRKSTNTPNDGGSTDDDRFRADIVAGTETIGVFRLAGVSRERSNEFVISNFELASNPGEINEDSDRLDLKYEKQLQWAGREQFITAGLVFDQADYSRRLGEPGVIDTTIKRGDVDHRAWFVAADVELVDALKFSVGYRADRFELGRNNSEFTEFCENEVLIGTPPNQVLVCLDPGGPATVEEFSPESDTWRNHALELGIVYTTRTNTRWYLSWAKSFRNPNIDELALAAEDLRPQTGRHLDAGVRTLVADQLEFSASVFYVRTENEILFSIDPETGQGVNLSADEPIERHGFETDLRWYASRALTLTANAGYTRAKFKESDTFLPLVPEWTAAVGAQYDLNRDLTLSVTGNYVGRRFDGNDFTNTEFPKVDSYTTADARLAYRLDGLQLYVGVANLFDEAYATSVYSNQFYPMPGRSYYAGFTYRVTAG